MWTNSLSSHTMEALTHTMINMKKTMISATQMVQMAIIIPSTVEDKNYHCSEKLNIQSYLEMLWSEKGYFGLLGNNIILVIILLNLIER